VVPQVHDVVDGNDGKGKVKFGMIPDKSGRAMALA
jgi:hypothetical protein